MARSQASQAGLTVKEQPPPIQRDSQRSASRGVEESVEREARGWIIRLCIQAVSRPPRPKPTRQQSAGTSSCPHWVHTSNMPRGNKCPPALRLRDLHLNLEACCCCCFRLIFLFNFFFIIIFPTQQQIWNLKRLGNRTLRPSPTKLLWSEFNWREKRKWKVKKVEWAERASAGVLDHQTPWDTINMCYRCGLLCAISLAGWCQFVTPPHLLQIICWPRKRSGSYMRGSPLYGSGKDERAPLLMCGSDGDRRCV